MTEATAQTPTGWARTRSALVPIVVLVLLCGSLFFGLELDPAPLKDLGHALYDEGNWVHNARSRVLFGNGRPDDLMHARAGAPLFDLLTTASFRLFGVSIRSARLAPTAALALIVVGLYLLALPSAGSRLRALVPAVLGGISFELLAWGKYGTPLSLVALTAGLFVVLWDRAVRSQGITSSVVAGLFAPLPLLAKITAVYTLIWIPVAIVISVIVRREVTRRQLAAFVLGACVGTLVVGTVLAARWDDLMLLSAAASAYNLAPAPEPLPLLRRLLTQPFRPLFASTGASAMMCLVILRGTALASQALEVGLRKVVRTVSSAEAACWVWLAVGLATLTVTGASAFERRTFPFLVPVVFLAGQSVLHARGDGLAASFRRARTSAPRLATLVVLVGVLAAGCWRALYGGLRILDARWLSVVGPEPGPAADWALAAVAAAAATAALALAAWSWRRAAIGLAAVCLVVNLGLDLCWYAGGSTTMRDASRRLAGVVADGEAITGPIALSLAIETRARPVFWSGLPSSREEPDRRGFSLLNPGWPGQLRGSGSPVVLIRWPSSGPSPAETRYLDPSMFPERTATLIATIGLAPLPFSRRPRVELEAWRLTVTEGNEPRGSKGSAAHDARPVRRPEGIGAGGQAR